MRTGTIQYIVVGVSMIFRPVVRIQVQITTRKNVIWLRRTIEYAHFLQNNRAQSPVKE